MGRTRPQAGQKLAALAVLLLVSGLATTSVSAAEITSANYTQPTTRYPHGVLGDEIEYGGMDIRLSDGSAVSLTLPQTSVFEDLAPRLADVDGDGTPEIVTVESSLTLGARLAVYDETGLVAATPFFGRSSRWLAPITTQDLDGDGKIEIAYIDRPHLAKQLRILRFDNGALTEIAVQDNLTNHRIGWDYIVGGSRDCGKGPEMITASGNWSQIMSSQLTAGGEITTTPIRAYTGPESIADALTCP